MSVATQRRRVHLRTLAGSALGAQTGPTGQVVAVIDTAGVTGQLLPARFIDVPAGRLGVLARPGMRRGSWLAADILAALGCRDDVSGAGRPGEGDWDHVTAWLATHQVRHLYIRHAWTLPLPVLQTLLTGPAAPSAPSGWSGTPRSPTCTLTC